MRTSVKLFTIFADHDNLFCFRDPVANSRDPLAKAILRAYLAKKQILSGDTQPSSLEDCAQLCKKSGLHLQESINLTSSLYQSTSSRLHQLAQLLCCDWLLGTRKDIWEFSQKPHFTATVPTDPVELRSFQNDLESLQKLTHNLPAALPRVNFPFFLLATMWTTPISLASDIKEEKLLFSLCGPSSLTFK